MPCTKGMRGCRADCAHRQFVREYTDERERQETAVEQQTERERSEFDIITFKQWLVATRGRGGELGSPA